MKNLQPIVILFSLFSLNLSAQSDSSFFKKHIEPIFYLQTQFNYTNNPDSTSVITMSGGKFGAEHNNAFSLRRGRIGLQFNYKTIGSRITFDVTEEGFHAKDLYFEAKDPWLDVFTLKGGYFKVPFGFEIEESSADRLFAERSRVIRTIFPSARDVGMQLTLGIPDEMGNDLHLDVAIYNGNSGGAETNNFKDLALNLGYDRSFNNDRIDLGIGFSYFLGAHGHIFDYGSGTGQVQLTRNIFEFQKINDTTAAFVIADSVYMTSTPSSPVKIKKKYLGVHVKLGYEWSESKGWKTQFFGSYVQGQQPGIVNKSRIDQISLYEINSYSFMGPTLGVEWKNSESPQSNRPAAVNKAVVPYHTIIRNFRGATAGIIQQIANTGLEVGFRFDLYDPNTDIEGKLIKEGVVDLVSFQPLNLSVADIKYTTYGFALNYQFNDYFKILAQYDMVRNEITQLQGLDAGNIGGADDVDDFSAYNVDVKDDVFTLRFQVSF